MKFGAYLILFSVLMILFNASKSTFVASKRIPVKSIKSPDGDIVDCINIYEQPAFDHPMLKNHIIQMRPSYYPEGVSAIGSNHAKQITQLWQLKGSCPKGTIPIRRANETDRIHGKKQPTQLIPPFGPTGEAAHQHSVAIVQGGKYHGAKARINVWEPKVDNVNEFSLAQIWLVAGSDFDTNTIEVGWTVSPPLFGDGVTRPFIYWTKDGYQSSGCYDMLCPGFVQTYSGIIFGGALVPVSTYHGKQQDWTVYVWKDPVHKSWWLSLQDIPVGYWPDSLFTSLADGASAVEWGGEIINTKPGGQHTTTQMGSGHFAAEGLGGAAAFKNLQVVDESNNLVDPPENQIKTVSEAPGCYDINMSKNAEFGYHFFYGGPGRNLIVHEKE